MNSYMNQLIQIANSIQQADANHPKGLQRLHLSIAIALSQKFTADLAEEMLSMESIGEQTNEVYNFTHIPNFHSSILDL